MFPSRDELEKQIDTMTEALTDTIGEKRFQRYPVFAVLMALLSVIIGFQSAARAQGDWFGPALLRMFDAVEATFITMGKQCGFVTENQIENALQQKAGPPGSRARRKRNRM